VVLSSLLHQFQHWREHSSWSIRPRLALPDSGPTLPPGVLRVAARMETADPAWLAKLAVLTPDPEAEGGSP
jgi:hypothetical protein